MQRHSLAWLTSEGWRAAQRCLPQHARTFDRWASADWPLVVRRRDPEAQPGEACLGLSLQDKRRIALRLDASLLGRRQQALPLQALLSAPLSGMPAWRAPLAELIEEAARAGIVLRLYGSASWQLLTGLPYLRPQSDIDLLFAPASREQLRRGLALLARHGERLPLDGEILFPCGRAVAWKEWLLADASQSGARVLAKDEGGVSLRRPAELTRSFAAGTPA